MFDPVSAVLAAALYAPIAMTSLKQWGATGVPRPSISDMQTTERTIDDPNVKTEELVEPVQVGGAMDRLSSVLLELASYQDLTPGWDGPHSQGPTQASVDAAKNFVSKIPAGLPLPIPMISPTGEVGVYWDEISGYADVSFDRDGVASFFARLNDGTERFSDGLAVSSLNRAWYFAELGEIAAPTALAA